MSLTTLTRLGAYEVLDLLGAGGMSEVYRARDTRLGREVAVKVLASASPPDPSRMDRLMKEARAVSRLNHPHICTLHDVGQENGVPFLVMELVEGTTLAHELAKGPLSVARALAVAIEIVDALDAAHSRGVIHRDMKPSNVMLTRTGVKLLDFGLARLQDPETPSDTASTLRVAPTEDGAVLGTLPYMSPEQVQGKRADVRADLFALGVMLYEMVTGRRPFQADNRAALTAAILTETPPPASSLSSASAYLDRVLARCLEKDPDRRWQSARDLASALQWARDGERGAPAGAIEYEHRLVQRRRGPLVWSIAAVMAVTAVVLLAFLARNIALGEVAPGAQRTVVEPPAAVGVERIVVAVLPVRNLTNDAEQWYLSEGLTEEIIAHLGNVNPSRLGVISRTSAMHYKDSTKRADQIGLELGAGYLLEASLQRVGNRVRVTTELIDTRTQTHVWSEQFERDARDMLALQRDVARAVADRTTSSLGVVADASRSATRRHSTNSMAYEHYLLGRHHWARDTSDDLQKAREHFEAAIGLDDTYALAYSGLAETYALLGSYDIMPIGTSHPLGRKTAEKALQLDDNLAEAHRSLAQILADHYWAWEEAESHHRRALDLAPEDATTLRIYSFHLAYTGRAIEAIPMAEKARTLDPVSTNARMNLGVVLQLAGRFDDSIRELEATIAMDPSFGFARSMLAMAYLGKGLPDRAMVEAAKAREINRGRPDIIAVQGHVLARAGHAREALKTIDDLNNLAGSRPPSPWGVAFIYIGLGDNDRAFEWLDKAVEARSWELPILTNLPPSSVSEEFRADPRYRALLERINLPSAATVAAGL